MDPKIVPWGTPKKTEADRGVERQKTILSVKSSNKYACLILVHHII